MGFCLIVLVLNFSRSILEGQLLVEWVDVSF